MEAKMRIVNWMFAALLATASLGCKDGAVREFIKENDSLVAAIKKAGDPDAARRVFDSKKEALRTKLEPLKTARSFQVKEESMTALTKSLQDGVTTVCSLPISAMGDEAKSNKYKSLCDDYTNAMSL
jgi:hypothetical protein